MKKKTEKGIFFLGDAHISSLNDPKQGVLVETLKEIASQAEKIYLIGDIFDFWFGYRQTVFYHYLPTLYTLFELKKMGIEINYIVGNHDYYPGYFFEKELNIKVFDGPISLNLGNIRVYISHGDEVIKKFDRGYQFLYAFLRNPIVKAIFRSIPPDLAWEIACWASKKSRNYTSKMQKPDLSIYRNFLEEKFTAGFNVVVVAHIHFPFEIDLGIPGSVARLYNAGDFLNHFTYVSYFPSGGFHLCYVPEELLQKYGLQRATSKTGWK